jgi:hypothetical protein
LLPKKRKNKADKVEKHLHSSNSIESPKHLHWA